MRQELLLEIAPSASYAGLAHAVAEGKPGALARVPSFASKWLPE
jgi:hypothetical protein